MAKLLKGRAKTRAKHLFGLQPDWNTQLLAFIKLPLKAEREWEKTELARSPTDPITTRQSRKDLALLVAILVAGPSPWLNACSTKRLCISRLVLYLPLDRENIPRVLAGCQMRVQSWQSRSICHKQGKVCNSDCNNLIL